MTALLSEIIDLMVGGIVGIGEGIGSGISSIVTSLFVGTGNTLTVFGGVVVVFAAIALGFSLTRWTLNFITSFGQRNR